MNISQFFSNQIKKMLFCFEKKEMTKKCLRINNDCYNYIFFPISKNKNIVTIFEYLIY